MKIKITRDTICDGKPVFKDDVVDATEASARTLLALEKAVINDSDEDKPVSAKELIAAIVAAETVEELSQLVDDSETRKTVLDALERRFDQLQE